MSYPRLPFLSAVESVDEGTKGRVSELLSEASRLLSSSTSSNAASNSTRPAAIPTSFENQLALICTLILLIGILRFKKETLLQ